LQATTRGAVFRVPEVVGDRLGRRRVVQQADAVTVGPVALGGNADPGIVHPDRLKNSLADVVRIRAPVQASHEFGENVGAGGDVIPRLAAGRPAGFEPGVADGGDHLVPRLDLPVADDPAEAGGVGKEVADGDRFLAFRAELRNVPRDAVVEVQQPALPKLRDGDARDRLGRRHPDHQRVRTHRHAATGEAERKVGQDLTPMGQEELCSHMQPGVDAFL
jgi:hypothetical protein